MKTLDIRQARDIDIKALCALDHIARVDAGRRQFIRDSVGHGIAYVAEVNGEIVGYTVLEHSFFERGFVAMLMVHPDRRRAGIGSALMRYVESRCQSDRLFTSTNQSNLPMQALMDRLDYKRSGKVDDLDPGDPELFYSKSVPARLP